MQSTYPEVFRTQICRETWKIHWGPGMLGYYQQTMPTDTQHAAGDKGAVMQSVAGNWEALKQSAAGEKEAVKQSSDDDWTVIVCYAVDMTRDIEMTAAVTASAASLQATHNPYVFSFCLTTASLLLWSFSWLGRVTREE